LSMKQHKVSLTPTVFMWWTRTKEPQKTFWEWNKIAITALVPDYVLRGTCKELKQQRKNFEDHPAIETTNPPRKLNGLCGVNLT
jgi:hypothetical protein